MSDIKVKERTPIKTLDKAKVGTQKIKDNLVSIKDKADNVYDSKYDNPEDYATQRIKDKGEIVANKGINTFNKQGKKSVEKTKDNIKKGIEKYKNKQLEKKIGNIKSKNNLVKAKSRVKSTSQNVKKANDLSKKAIKTSQKVAKNTAKATKESIKASRRVAQATKELTKRAIQGTKAAIKATIAAVKAMIAGTKAIISLLIAGGWISVIIILVVCIFGAIAAVFNSGGNEETKAMWGTDLVAVAETQIGVTGGDPYWSWYGFDSRVEWCACFVSWCGDQVGYINDGIMPKFSGCVDGVQWYKDHNMWFERSDGAMPFPGDIIFFDWKDKNTGEQDGKADHVGIVKRFDAESQRVITIEGNSGDACKENSYSKDEVQILGYGSNRVRDLQELNPRAVTAPQGSEYEKTMEAWKGHH